MKNVDLIISRFTVYLFVLTVAFNMFFIYVPIDKVLYRKIYYLSNELINTPLVYIILASIISIRLKLCLANWIAISGFALLNLFNLIAIITKGEYDIYKTVTGQTLMVVLALLSIILLSTKISKYDTSRRNE